MNTYILLVVMSVYRPLPNNFFMTEFKTKEACEIALDQAKSFYKTINSESKCISVEQELKKKRLKDELHKLKENLEKEQG